MRSVSTKSSLYKTQKALDLDRDHSMARLKSLLANVIFRCIDLEVDKALINNCNKWASEGNEKDIFEVAFIAGIANAVKVLFYILITQPTNNIYEVILTCILFNVHIGEVQLKVEVVVGEGSEVCSIPDSINEV